MKVNFTKIAMVLLIAGVATAHAQSSAPLTSTTSSTTSSPGGNQVKAAPVQIKPKAKPVIPAATPASPSEKSKVPALKIVEKPQNSAAKSASTKPAAVQGTAKVSSPTQKSGSTAAAKATSIGAKPVATAQPGNKTAAPSASPLAKLPAKGTAATKTNVATTNQKPAAGKLVQKPTAAPSAAKTTVAVRPPAPPTTNKKSTQATPVAVKPAKAGAPGVKPAKAQGKAASGGKISAVEQPMKPAAASPASTEQAAAPAPRKIERAGRRDPFVNPIQSRSIGPAGSCATGKRCLDIEQVVLKGIVRTRDGNMALVENASRRPYVLRENDALFNGTVEKITGDTVLFRQNVQDFLGHTSTREVIKRVSAPSV